MTHTHTQNTHDCETTDGLSVLYCVSTGSRSNLLVGAKQAARMQLEFYENAKSWSLRNFVLDTRGPNDV